jgi:hypothetical protein
MKLLGIVAVIAVGLWLAWGWIFPSGALRYRLTIEVEVDGKIYSGSGVIEARYEIPPRWMLGANRVVPSVRGEAVVVDLGERGVLFALLRGVPVEESRGYVADATAMPLKEFNVTGSGGVDDSVLRKMGNLKARAEIPPSRLPMMVRFRNLDDPKSVERVNPSDLSASFGLNTRLLRVTIETTRDGVTSGIETRLKWLKGLKTYLDGKSGHVSNDVSNVLTGSDFRWGL